MSQVTVRLIVLGANEAAQWYRDVYRRGLMRRHIRVLEVENEILKRASAYSAWENVLPNGCPAGL